MLSESSEKLGPPPIVMFVVVLRSSWKWNKTSGRLNARKKAERWRELYLVRIILMFWPYNMLLKRVTGHSVKRPTTLWRHCLLAWTILNTFLFRTRDVHRSDCPCSSSKGQRTKWDYGQNYSGYRYKVENTCLYNNIINYVWGTTPQNKIVCNPVHLWTNTRTWQC